MIWKACLILCLTACFSASTCAAQSEVKGFSEQILNLAKSLNKNIDEFFDVQKAKRLNRELSYLRTDLAAYLKIRGQLMTYLERNNYNTNNEFVRHTVPVLEKQLASLDKRLDNISPLLDEEIGAIADSVSEETSGEAQVQWVTYLTPLEKLITNPNSPIDRRELKKNGRQVYVSLTKSLRLFTETQEKLRKKFGIGNS
jgi:DNA-binding XRE family transcriptional regulator